MSVRSVSGANAAHDRLADRATMANSVPNGPLTEPEPEPEPGPEP